MASGDTFYGACRGQKGDETKMGEEGKEQLWKGMRQVLGSRMKTLEILSVLEGIKPVARVLCQEEDAQATQNLLASHGLSLASADFKALLESPSGTAFAEKASQTSLNDARKGHLVLYISKDPAKTEMAKGHEASQNHKELGALLGYPACCTVFFERHFSSKHADITLDIVEASEGWEFPLYTNIAARHVDASLLSHFPHEFSCRESVEHGKRLMELARKYGQEDAYYLCMQTAVVYTEKEGVVYLQHPVKNGNMISYSNATPTMKGKLYYLLNEEKRITVHDKHSFQVGEHRIEGKNIGVMLFS